MEERIIGGLSLIRIIHKMDSIDNYQVLNLIGKGGFASVFKAK